MSRKHGASSFILKTAAIAGMTSNHVANVFAAQLPGWLTAALCTFGGLTFPIMAFLLCVGYAHTSNVRRYAQRLGAFAVVAQIPYSLLWGATANVLVTLLIGLGLLWLNDHLRNRGLFALAAVGGIALSGFCDWGIIGPVMILLFWVLRKHPHGVALAMLVPLLAYGLPGLQWTLEEMGAAGLLGEAPVETTWEQQLFGNGAATLPDIGLLDVESPEQALLAPQLSRTVNDASSLAASLGVFGYYTVGFGLATLLMLTYDGKRGRSLKWFFYSYYPGHLMVLWGIAQFLS